MAKWPLAPRFSSFCGPPNSDVAKVLSQLQEFAAGLSVVWVHLMQAVAITLVNMWCHRNGRVHKGKILEIGDLIRSVQRRYAAHKEAWDEKECIQIIEWQPRLEGTIKINFDVAVKDNWLCAAAVGSNSARGPGGGGGILKIRTGKTRRSEPIKWEA